MAHGVEGDRRNAVNAPDGSVPHHAYIVGPDRGAVIIAEYQGVCVSLAKAKPQPEFELPAPVLFEVAHRARWERDPSSAMLGLWFLEPQTRPWFAQATARC